MSTRHFVILLGRPTVEETLAHVEETHGEIVDHHDEEHGRPVRRAKLHESMCRKLVYGVVEIQPHGTRPKPARPAEEVRLAEIPDLWPPDIFDLPGDKEE